MRDDARKEKRSVRVCHVFRRKSLIRQEVPNVIQRHEHHDEPAQDVHRNQPRSLSAEKRRFCDGVGD